MAEDSSNLQTLVAEVAAAYFSNSHVSPTEIPHVVGQIAQSLAAIAGGAIPGVMGAAEPAAQHVTSGQIRKSITPTALISFEDNKPYKTLKRHLAVRGLTPAQYREKWGLPRDYPMVAPSYSAQRSNLAKSLGLGRKPGAAAPKRGRAAKGK
jgi:predicted transcriptional regulator